MRSLAERISEIVGEKYVSDESHVRWAYAKDVGPWRERMPDVVVRPGDPYEVSAIVDLANRLRVPIWPRGGGATPVGAGMPLKPYGILLDMTRMNQIEVDEGDMVAVAEAGATFASLIHQLWKKGLDTFRGPGSGLAASVGGAASMSSNWHASLKYGGTGDVVRGVEVVLPTGEIIRTASAYKWPHKFYARYHGTPDLTGLFIGDHGTLGVKTKVSFGLWEKPEFADGVGWGVDNVVNMQTIFQKISRKRLATDMNFHDKLIMQFLAYLRNEVGYDGVGPEMRRWLKAIYDDLEESGNVERFEKNGDMIAFAVVEEHSRAVLDEKVKMIEKIVRESGGWIMGRRYAMDYHDNQLHGFYQPFMNVDPGLGTSFIGGGGLIRPSQFAKSREILYSYLEENKEDLQKHDISGTFFGYVLNPSAIAIYPGVLGDQYHMPSRERVVYHSKRIRDEYMRSDCGWQPYFAGEWGTEGYMKTLYAPYYYLLKNIKKLLDPNNILNPGMLGL
jgi:FAD/FMN-containing dehydrogenase